MDTYQKLTDSFPELAFQSDVPLADKTYFKLGGPAEILLQTKDEQTIAKLYKWCTQNKVPVTALGGASNVIVSDDGISGLVLQITNDSCNVISNESSNENSAKENNSILKVGAGCKTALLVRQSVDFGLAGLEYFLGVPGTIGGAIYNNAHYLEDLIGTHVYRVKIANQNGEILWLSQKECAFGYDSSRFHTSKEIILEVEFSLTPGPKESSMALIAEATKYRASTQPLGAPSSGCIFQNAPNTPELQDTFPQYAKNAFVGGGFLIDKAGLKGTKIGGISVSQKHAAFFINDGTGTAAEVQELIKLVQDTVKKKFGVELKEEVFVLK